MLFVGTGRGLFVLTETHGRWSVSDAFFADVGIAALTPSGETTVLVGTTTAGAFALDVPSRTIRAIGAGVLPSYVRSIAVCPTDTNKLYAGTEPAGIYETDDGGKTWRPNAAVARIGSERQWRYPVPSVAPHIRHVVFDALNPQRVYACVQIGGILRSEDGGATWEDVIDSLDADAHSLAAHPSRPGIVYAACGGGGGFVLRDLPPDAVAGRVCGNAIYRSADYGKTWISISGALERTYGAPLKALNGAGTTLLAAVARGVPPTWEQRDSGADAVLIRSDDEGSSWQPIGGAGLPSSFTRMIEAIEVDGDRRDRLFIGIGGEAEMQKNATDGGEVYALRDDRWTRLPFDFAPITAIVAR